MTTTVLFHHVRGLTEGIEGFADELRRRGHTVHAPDLFDGKTFDSIEAGLAFVHDIGFGTVMERGHAAAADLPADVAYAGFSLGVMPAQLLLQTTPGARGGLFIAGFIDPDELNGSWPEDVPVQVHAMDRDPFFVDEGDIDAARAVAAEHTNLAITLYPGAGHLFADSTDADYDAEAARLLLDRADAFLSSLAP